MDVGISRERKRKYLDPFAPIPAADTFDKYDQQLTESVRVTSAAYLELKRALDVVVSAVVLVLLSPLMLVAAVAIRVDTPGPALFHQLRVGKGGRIFTLHKFRGMYSDACERWPALYSYKYPSKDGRGVMFHFRNDPRVTRVGQVLRRLSIDELPNFWNVLKGDMSVVGPRPQIPEMMQYYGGFKEIILSTQPGIFSLPKVIGRDGLDLLETNRYDAWYVHNRSLWLDFCIVIWGVWTVLRRHNVFQ